MSARSTLRVLSTRLALAGAACGGIALASASSGCGKSARPEPAAPPRWQLLASDLPSALLSVSARSPSDVFAVGADKGHGPLVLHFDGRTWARLDTHHQGDLWWVATFPDGAGPVLMAGADATVLRYDGATFERLPTPGLAKQTLYGVWGTSASDFYAVGSAAGRDGIVWHYHDGRFEAEAIPADVPRMAGGELPGFFKVWGRGDEVWVVGAAGAVLHRKGAAPFTVIPTPTHDTLFTVHGTADHLLTVGGAGNGRLFDLSSSDGAAPRDLSPPGAGLLQGVFATDGFGDWASGERGLVFSRTGSGAFEAVDHGIPLPATTSLHSITVDSAGGVWTVGGNVLTPALDAGVLLHFGSPVPTVAYEDDTDASAGGAAMDAAAPGRCAAAVVAAGKGKSIARRWDEQALAAIRLDLPYPTVHSRNLFHLSAAMWDAWAAYDPSARGVFVREKHTAADVEQARDAAISHAAFRLLTHRYTHAVGAATTLACLRAVMADLGYDASDAHDTGDDPVALGNRIARTVIAATMNDGSNEAGGYDDPTVFKPANPPLVFDGPGTTLDDVAHWQPINLSVAVTQNGIVQPAGVQTYMGSQWGGVTPFAMRRRSTAEPWHDPGPVPSPASPEMRDWLVDVIRKTAETDSSDPTTIDISPGAYGHDSLGANDGKGWAKNPVTGQPYAPEVVPRADFARVMAEFWADGPKSETPPGHWNVIANGVADTPGFHRQLFGRGPELDPLAWDVHVYLALNGALHDAAIAAWDIKRRDTTVRPISLIRWMGAKGQSSDPAGPSYDPQGLPLVPGLIEVVTPESSAAGQRHAGLSHFVGQVAVRGWLGEPADRSRQVSGVGWVRAVDWITYQRRTFVTPAFPGFISGHSTFSRAGAEVLAALTGSPYFPGGFAEYVMPRDTFLQFERGPSTEVRLEWASYFDASDEAGQSRIFGSIHILPDDFAGRRIGHLVGLEAVVLARRYFDGAAPP